MVPGIDRKFLCLVMMVLCLHTTVVVCQTSSKDPNITKPIHLNIATMLQPPLVMKDPVSGQYSGIMIDVLKAMGYEIDSITITDDRTYGMDEDPKKLTDVVSYVAEGKVDLGIVAPLDLATFDGIRITIPAYMQGSMPIFKKSKWTPKYSTMVTLIEPFSPGLWCLIIAMCVLTSGFFFLVRYLSPFEAPKKDRSVPSKSSLMYTISSLFGQDHREAPRSFSGRVLAGVWWTFSLMTAGAYVAGLITIIFRMNPQINTLPFSTLEEMVKQGDFRVLVVKDSMTHYFSVHRENEAWKTFKDKVVFVDSTETALKMMTEGDGQYAVLLPETTARYLVNETPCNKMVVTEPFGYLYYTFICKRGADLCFDVDKRVTKLSSTGQIDELLDKYYKGLCHKGEAFSYKGLPFVDTFGKGDPTSLNPTTLTIERFGSAYILLTVGFAAAILVLVAEILYARWKGPQFFPPKVPGLNDTERTNDQEMTPHGDS